MTYLMDKFFIAIGLDETEIRESAYRGWLYVGMVYLLGIGSAFGVMTLIG
ncbi:hypothetical protein GCM10007853_21030 [Algimonas ampicilliniresistens]|uniref:Uncharacterized protein n=1 Tax=Algimonas ampicilliniresistens TaxID=1298735 RepID=A0ABQ5V9N6_9PROT|nr:hypothetical protein GCM10007853_21030 [Algimonas ampicilliniresistens]